MTIHEVGLWALGSLIYFYVAARLITRAICRTIRES